ncbi:putative tape-measure protein [Clostridium phage phi3626]|uniref:Phage tail tape measure protein, family n=1 Tax=Clostridium perfringens B str. ATCC 3626 TaxID=451754 RepID=A0AAV3BP95_CLOPF|nr:phage tail tape measure protein [Clostridium perfringens]NP_612842.1 tail length tape measure protein [Clostridium phage phi3626]AAL96783.1 putative tape-measure protein [Clostridium phage phi3626]EDT22912.1 phage tail tape measure protein, family [Clostridium perfringens B str. ATCC 3626]
MRVIGANVKIGANTSSFQKQMKEMAQELKRVGSSYNLANTQAKLFGSRTDLLKSQQSELTAKMKIQNNMIKTQGDYLTKLNSDLDKQKSKQSELAKKISETSDKYKKSVQETGKNSEESKKLKEELKQLEAEYTKNNKAIDTNVIKISNAEIKLNNSKKALEENKKALENINKELDKSKIDKFSEGIGKAGEKAGNLSNKMKPASVAMIGLGSAATFANIKFEDSLANINTLLDDQSHLESYKNKIRELSDETGMSLETVSEGMYTAISSIGDGGKETEKIFETMAKSAKAGGAEVQDAVSLISAGMKGYNQVNDETAKKISDLAFQTAKLGVTTFPEMAKSMQQLFPLANNLELSLEELFTDMATLTGVTGNTAEVSTQLKAVFSNLIKPTTDMQKLMQKYGFQNGQAMLKSEGLIGTLKILQKETGGQSDKMGKLFSSTEGLTALTALTGSQFDTLVDKSKKMKESIGTTDSALTKINSTLGNDLRTSLNLVRNSFVDFGEILAPFISIGANTLSTIITMINGLSEGQKKLVVGFGASFIGINLLLGGFSKLSKGIQSNIKFTKDMIKVTKEGVSKLKDFGKAAREGTNLIGKFGKGIVTTAKSVASFTLELIKSAGKGLASLGKGVLNCIKSMGSFTLELIKNTAIGIKNGAIWVGNMAKMLAYKAAQVTVTVATKAMTVAQKALNLAMAMNPITLIIGLLVALGGTFILLYNKCEWFRNGVNNVWNSITSIFTKFDNFLTGIFTRDWTQSFGLLGVPLNAFLGTVGSIWEGVKGVFNGVIRFFKGVFTGNWREVFQGLSDIVSSIFGAIGGIIKAPINAAISGINWVIRQINKISFDVPSWIPGIGGSHFGINLPTIPALAEGGIVTQATMALVGEGKEHEAVIPLSKLDKLVTSSVKKVLENYSNKKDEGDFKSEPKVFQIIVPIDGRVLAEIIIDEHGNVLTKKVKDRRVVRGKI